MNIKEYIKNNIVLLDGGMGTLLQERGLGSGEFPELWNITHPSDITEIHTEYYNAGSNIVLTNTFGANRLKFDSETLDKIICSAVGNAKEAKKRSQGSREKYIALDIGPTGKLLAPFGDLDFEEAVSVFSETVRAGVKYGVDLIFIETMNDSYETKAALLAAKENSNLPVFVTNAYGSDGKLMTGADPHSMVAMLEGMGADAIGVNCSFGPDALEPVVREYLKYASVPVIFKPNAGMPKVENGKTVYDVMPDKFSESVAGMMQMGIKVAGGCCGTTPEYIRALACIKNGICPSDNKSKCETVISSYTHAVSFGDKPLLIGERINPTGKKAFKEAIRNNDIGYILKEGIRQQECGVDVLDVNVGLPEIDEVGFLTRAVCELQSVCDLPLQIDTANYSAMESAVRRYNGKPLINSVNGKEESMRSIFPIAKKYGGVVIALTLDENGIPDTSEERVEIAKKILKTASEYGIEKKDIIFDPLALTVSADKNAADVTLSTVEAIRKDLGCHTSLGISNVSFGLPVRDMINATYFTMALTKGLSAAIMNPYSNEMMKAYRTYMVLAGLDDNCEKYIGFASSVQLSAVTEPVKTEKANSNSAEGLYDAITKGMKSEAAAITEQLVLITDPLEIVQSDIIPALDSVGKGFEDKKIFLPQLLMSAEAAKAAFEVIKREMLKSTDKDAAGKMDFVIATVRGDIHDIGKNIVKLLLENYGFRVTDLGRDVKPEVIVETAKKLHAPVVGLSALMTTTVPAMAETIRLIKKEAPWCKVVVGGAVLTQEYADSIGADKYARDAMETVRYAEQIESLMKQKKGG